MDFAWFIYTVTLMVVMVVACATGVVSWVLTNRRDSLAAAATLLIYALETSIILFDEYIRAKPLGVDYINQGLTHPAFEIVVRSAFVVAIWLWVLLRFHVHMRRSAVCLCSLGCLCLSALAAPIGEQAGVLRTMLYWGLRDIALIGVFVWLGWRYLSTPSEHERADMGRHLPFFVTALVLSLLLQGKDIQNISSELVISTGTVKAHPHRIYRKAGVVSGQDLIGLFWRE